MSRIPDRQRRHHQRAHKFTDRKKQADKEAARLLINNPDLWDDDTPLECGLENPDTCEACE